MVYGIYTHACRVFEVGTTTASLLHAKPSGCGIEVLGTAIDLRACNDVWGRGVAWLMTITVQSKGYEAYAVCLLAEAVGVVVFPRGLTNIVMLC